MEEPTLDYTESNKMSNVSESSDVPVSQDFASEVTPSSETINHRSETSRQEEGGQSEFEQAAVNESMLVSDDNPDNLELNEPIQMSHFTEPSQDEVVHSETPGSQTENVDNGDLLGEPSVTAVKQTTSNEATALGSSEPDDRPDNSELLPVDGIAPVNLEDNPVVETDEINENEVICEESTKNVEASEMNDVSNELYDTCGGLKEQEETPSVTECKQSTHSGLGLLNEQTKGLSETESGMEFQKEETYCPEDGHQVSDEVVDLSEEKSEAQGESEAHLYGKTEPQSDEFAVSCKEKAEFVSETTAPEVESIGKSISDEEEGDSNVSNLTGSNIGAEATEQPSELSEAGTNLEDDHTDKQEESEISVENKSTEQSLEFVPSGEKLILHEELVKEKSMLQEGEEVIAPVSFVPEIIDREVEARSDVEYSEMDYKQADNEQEGTEEGGDSKSFRVMENDKGEPSEEILIDVNEFQPNSAVPLAFDKEINGEGRVSEEGEEQKSEVISAAEWPHTDQKLGAGQLENVEQEKEDLNVDAVEEETSDSLIEGQEKPPIIMESNETVPDSLYIVSAPSEVASPEAVEFPVSYAAQESFSTHFETVEELNKTSQDQECYSPDHVTVEENENQERVHPQQQQPEVNEPIHSSGTRDRPVCFTQALELEQDRLSIEPMEDVLVDQAEPSEYVIDTSCVVDVCTPLETVTEREQVEQFISTDQPTLVQCEQPSELVEGMSDQGKLNSETTSEVANSQPVSYDTEERDFSNVKNGELSEEVESMISPTTAAQIHRTLKNSDGTGKTKSDIKRTAEADQAELLISTTEQEQRKVNLINGYSPDSDELHSDKENDDRALFEEKYARLTSKFLPRDQNVFDPGQRKERSKTLEPNFDTDQLTSWNEAHIDVKRKSATLGRSGSRKRPRLLPKPSVNDDHLFPDSVTPSKVDRNLSVRSLSVGLPEGTYDVPYIDDDAFVPRRLRTQSINNGKDENGSEQSTESDEYMWDPSLSRYSALDPAHRADIDECIQTPKLAPKTGASAPRGKHQGAKNLIKDNKNKGPKKRRFFDLCSCMGRPNRK